MREYRLMVGTVGGGISNMQPFRVRAAYFKEEGTFVVFKDADNQAVYSVRQDHLVSVERLDEQQCDQSDPGKVEA
ncbi:hypothetical protein AAW14_06430 [Streptomyces hygroscopicus]|nr:hypothetical protein [Streptomyces hygroscopicus]